VRVRTPQAAGLAPVLSAAGAAVRDDGSGQLMVSGLTADRIGDLAFDNAIRLHELAPALASLEEAFMELTSSSVDFRAAALPGALDPDPAVLAPAGSGS
jgi:ABC-2 type transport system ATP-binding protein